MNTLPNPFRPGAGHMPPYLAGREHEKQEFTRLLEQSIILKNLVLTGLRGVGKTVLLNDFQSPAQRGGWLWVNADLSESVSLNESNICTRLLADLSVLTASITIKKQEDVAIGFTSETNTQEHKLGFSTLQHIFTNTPGLPADKLKHVLELVWSVLSNIKGFKGIVFAYDEAQNLADHADKAEFPLSLLLDTFQSIQRKNIRFMLALTGLPTLFPKLVETRTFSERMFRVLFLDKLEPAAAREAIEKPLENHEIKLPPTSVEEVVHLSGGYPYFVQFMCREVYDLFLQQLDLGIAPAVPVREIVQKLDSDFFAGRWSRATDRQRELLAVISALPDCDDEFSVQDVVSHSQTVLEKPFSSSHVSQMLATLSDAGLVYKNRHGKYSFAVPLLGDFIKRQEIQAMKYAEI